MKKTRFTEEQMVTILREADQRPVPEVAKKHGISGQTIYAWRKHFGTLEAADMKRLRQLEQENGRLKRMVADRDLEIDGLKEITQAMAGARLRRQQVAFAAGRGLCRRRACALLLVARSTQPSWPRCGSWPASIRAMTIGRSGSSSSGAVTC